MKCQASLVAGLLCLGLASCGGGSSTPPITQDETAAKRAAGETFKSDLDVLAEVTWQESTVSLKSTRSDRKKFQLSDQLVSRADYSEKQDGSKLCDDIFLQPYGPAYKGGPSSGDDVAASGLFIYVAAPLLKPGLSISTGWPEQEPAPAACSDSLTKQEAGLEFDGGVDWKQSEGSPDWPYQFLTHGRFAEDPILRSAACTIDLTKFEKGGVAGKFQCGPDGPSGSFSGTL